MPYLTFYWGIFINRKSIKNYHHNKSKLYELNSFLKHFTIVSSIMHHIA
jgi:hypothetical protein